MNHERLFKTVLLDLTSTLTKMEDELERIINGDYSLEEKSHKVRRVLNKIALTEASINKFNSMFLENKDNTNS